MPRWLGLTTPHCEVGAPKSITEDSHKLCWWASFFLQAPFSLIEAQGRGVSMFTRPLCASQGIQAHFFQDFSFHPIDIFNHVTESHIILEEDNKARLAPICS